MKDYLNSWIVQANPEKFYIDWFLDEYARNNLNEPDWWVIHKIHKGQICSCDELFIWKAASEPSEEHSPEYYNWRESHGQKGKIAGIVARGEVIGYPRNFNPPLGDLEKFRKYRSVQSWDFDKIKDWQIDCIHKNVQNIRATHPLLKDTIQKELTNSQNTPFSSFLSFPRGRRSVKLGHREADIIRTLFFEYNVAN